jgi:serine/threonine-protein kinase
VTWERGAVVLDRYRLEERVGAGGMGEVWCAEHVGVGAKVAIKTLLPATRSSHEMIARFKREAYYLGRIRSDHVARVLDFIEDERFGLVLVMDFVEGDKLANVLSIRGKLGVEEAIEIGVDLASALCDLHRANVVHRDLKPANVILRPVPGGGRRATVVDFGLSRLFSTDPEGDTGEEITGITKANMALGTVEYMAPEQVLNSRDVTASSDVYALGAILFRCASGQHVFGDLREGHLAHAKITREAPPLVTGRDDPVARGLEQIVAQALRKKPSDRWERADLVLAELATLRELSKIPSGDVESTDTEDGPPSTRARRCGCPSRRPSRRSRRRSPPRGRSTTSRRRSIRRRCGSRLRRRSHLRRRRASRRSGCP